MTTFKKGDRVRYVGGKVNSMPSTMGTVVNYYPDTTVIEVHFDNYHYDWWGGASGVPYHTSYARAFVLEDENL